MSRYLRIGSPFSCAAPCLRRPSMSLRFPAIAAAPWRRHRPTLNGAPHLDRSRKGQGLASQSDDGALRAWEACHGGRFWGKEVRNSRDRRLLHLLRPNSISRWTPDHCRRGSVHTRRVGQRAGCAAAPTPEPALPPGPPALFLGVPRSGTPVPQRVSGRRAGARPRGYVPGIPGLTRDRPVWPPLCYRWRGELDSTEACRGKQPCGPARSVRSEPACPWTSALSATARWWPWDGPGPRPGAPHGFRFTHRPGAR